jgi:UDP-glucose 6-dehydrogenase
MEQGQHTPVALRRHCMTKANHESKVKKDAIEKHDYNTYEASISKYSGSSTSTEALPAAAELEEAMSSTRFPFLSTPTSSARAGGGDVDELVSSSDSLTSSPS